MMVRENLKHIIVAVLLAVAGIVGYAQKTYIVCVGIDNNDSGKNSLANPKNDAKAIAKFYNDKGNSEVFVLLDKNATRDHILRVLKSQFGKATAKDEIIFVYSGHGFDGGVSCYDTKNLIYCNEVQSIMQRSKAARKMMFVNSCHSGSFKKKYNRERGQGYRSKNKNVLLYMSSRPNEVSWGSPNMKHSFFINRLLEALNGKADANSDGAVTARELFNYVNEKVIDDTDDVQHPQMYGKFADDMIIVKTR